MAATAKRTPLVDGTDVYVPRFELKLGGETLGADVLADVGELVYRDHLDEFSTLELRLQDWDAEKRAFRFSDSELFLPGTTLDAAIGYQGDDTLATLFRGKIQSLGLDAPQGSSPRAVVTALDSLHELRRAQHSVVYEEQTDSEIAQAVAQRLGLSIQVNSPDDQELRHAYVLQHAQYDILFLRDRARALGCDLFVRLAESGGTAELVMEPTQAGEQPEYLLTFGRSLNSFEARIDTANQVKSVVVRSWDPLDKTLIEARSETPRVTTLPSGDRSKLAAAFAEREEIVSDWVVETAAEAQSLALGVHDDIARRLVMGHGECVGLPRLRAGTRLLLDGLGDRFSGSYTVIASEHRIGSRGYSTRFECRMESAA